MRDRFRSDLSLYRATGILETDSTHDPSIQEGDETMITSSGDSHSKGAMMYETTPGDSLRELAYRERDGLEVTLLWDKRCDRLMVSVFDSKTGDHFALPAPHGK